MNDFNKIKKELEWVLCNKGCSTYIDSVNSKVIHNNRIGNSINHTKRRNYNDVFNKVLNNDEYFIIFTDFSILHFDYMFDDENQVIFSRLSYLPHIDNEAIENTQYSKYIRIDYEPDDHKEIVHTKCHLHIGIDKNNFRIPVSTIIYPLEFIYFILKYIYHEDSKFTNLITLNNEKEILLTNNEISKLRLMIG